MADDIVKRLREWHMRTTFRADIDEAADEIERLRAEVKRLDDGWTDCVWHLQSAHKAMGVWKPALVAAEADRDRLRAALEDVRERVQEIANRYHEQHFVIDTVARLLCETIPAALAGDAKHEVVRLGDGATYCPGCTVTFPVEIGPVVAGSGENIAGTFTVGPVVPAEAAPNIAESNDRADAAPKCRLPTFKDCGVCMEYPFCGCGAQAWTDRIRVALLPYVRHTHPNCHDVKAPGSTERHGCLCGLADALAMPLVQPPAAPAPESRPVAYECDQCRHPISKPAWTAFEPTCGYCGGTYRPAVQPNEGHT